MGGVISDEQFGEQGELFPAPAQERRYQHLPEIPESYYQQHGHAQLALPGMEMSPEEHVAALGRATGLEPRLERLPSGAHEISLTDGLGGFSWLEWQGRETGRAPMSSVTYSPGEVRGVSVDQGRQRQGIATRMVETAQRIADEHPEGFSAPRVAQVRTADGLAFSKELQEKHGMEPL
jgi:GNAT superfamily N-acetyltransferase